MTPFLVRSHPKLEENESSVCVQRGPITYCLEAEDVQGVYLSSQAQFTEQRKRIGNEEVVTLETDIYRMSSVSGALYERLGFTVVPKSDEERYDIIQSIELGSKERLLAFCTHKTSLITTS